MSPRVGWVRRKDGDDSESRTPTGDRWTNASLQLASLDVEAASPTTYLTTRFVSRDSLKSGQRARRLLSCRQNPCPTPWACQPLICSCSYKYLQIPAAEEQDIPCQLGLPGWKLVGGIWQVRTMGGRAGLLWRDRCSGLLSSQRLTLQSLAHGPCRSRNISHSSGSGSLPRSYLTEGLSPAPTHISQLRYRKGPSYILDDTNLPRSPWRVLPGALWIGGGQWACS